MFKFLKQISSPGTFFHVRFPKYIEEYVRKQEASRVSKLAAHPVVGAVSGDMLAITGGFLSMWWIDKQNREEKEKIDRELYVTKCELLKKHILSAEKSLIHSRESFVRGMGKDVISVALEKSRKDAQKALEIYDGLSTACQKEFFKDQGYNNQSLSNLISHIDYHIGSLLLKNFDYTNAKLELARSLANRIAISYDGQHANNEIFRSKIKIADASNQSRDLSIALKLYDDIVAPIKQSNLLSTFWKTRALNNMAIVHFAVGRDKQALDGMMKTAEIVSEYLSEFNVVTDKDSGRVIADIQLLKARLMENKKSPLSVVSHSVPPFDINVALDAASMVNMGLQTRPDPIPVGGEYFGFVPNESMVNRAALDSELVRYMGGFMDGRVGDGEEGLISRNDTFCNIFVKLANMDKYSRNKHEDSTALTTRADRTDKYEGVSLVMTEEKAEALNGAIEDLKRKIRWIPHFEKLPFVFGIVIGGHQLQIYAIDSNINRNRLFSADLNVIVERWNCIIAAINMARVINSFVDRNLIIPSTLRFDIWNRRNNKKIRLQLNCAEVEFPQPDTFNRMVKFYQATVNVKNIEHMSEYNEEKMRVKLNPVGVNRKPDSYAELVAAMKSICDCLFELHQVHYFHCDVRWDNIICVLGAWYLIDCEYACHDSEHELLSSRSSNDIKKTHVKFPTQSWDSTFDLYQVGLLLDDPEMIRFTENTLLLELKEMLKSRKPSVAAIKAS